MEQEKTSIELLSEFAKSSGRTVKFTETAYPSNNVERIVHHHRTLYIPNNDEATSYFVCYRGPKDFGDNGMYSGVFSPIYLPKSAKFTLRSKNIIDTLNPFSKKNRYKTGNTSFDKKIILDVSDSAELDAVLKNTNIQDEIIEALAIDARLKIVTNQINISFVPGLKNASHFGIYITQDWLFDSEIIEKLFVIAEDIRQLINK